MRRFCASECWELAKTSRGRASNLASALMFLAQRGCARTATGFAGQILLQNRPVFHFVLRNHRVTCLKEYADYRVVE